MTNPRNERSQDMLAQLAAHPRIHLVCPSTCHMSPLTCRAASVVGIPKLVGIQTFFRIWYFWKQRGVLCFMSKNLLNLAFLQHFS